MLIDNNDWYGHLIERKEKLSFTGDGQTKEDTLWPCNPKYKNPITVIEFSQYKQLAQKGYEFNFKLADGSSTSFKLHQTILPNGLEMPPKVESVINLKPD